MKKIISALAFVIFISCSHSTSKNDKNLLSKDKMIQVLLDLHLTESNIDASKTRRDEKEMEKLAIEYEKVFKRNGVTSQQFYSSFNYLLNHPAEMDSTYKELVSEATQSESQLYRAHNGPPQDSATRARLLP